MADQTGWDYGDSYYYQPSGTSWWWTPAGMAVRYTIVALIFAIVFFYFIGGYYHAKRRLSQGLAPMPYHRWMVRRQMYEAQYMHGPQQRYYERDGMGQAGYPMSGYPAPPPAYHAAYAPPPRYEPPQGGTKVAADQRFQETTRAGEDRAGESSVGVSMPAPAHSRET